ncbi:MAG: hypothetical protein RLY31_2651 [Bacteroidota bacterium]|jgi:Rrf2 family protein
MMTHKAKYAIKALVCLAEDGGLVRTSDISDRARVPRKFLEAILLELKRHRMVESVRGAGGGYRLAMPAGRINLADIHRLFEGPIALLRCASLMHYRSCEDCADVEACRLRLAMVGVREQTLRALQEVTLEQVMSGKKPR